MCDQQRDNRSDEGGAGKGKKKSTNQKKRVLKKEIEDMRTTNAKEEAECDELKRKNERLKAKIDDNMDFLNIEYRKGCISGSSMSQWKEAQRQYADIFQNPSCSSQENGATDPAAYSSNVASHTNGETTASVGLFHGKAVTSSTVERISCAAASTIASSASQTATGASGLQQANQNGDGVPTFSHSMLTAVTPTDTVVSTIQIWPQGASQLGTTQPQNSLLCLSQCNGVDGTDSVHNSQVQQTQRHVTPGSVVQDDPLRYPDVVNGHNGGFVNGMTSLNHHDSVSQIQQMQNHDTPVSLAQANSFNPSVIMTGHNNGFINDVNFVSHFDSRSDACTHNGSQPQQTQNSATPASLLQAGPNNHPAILNGCSNIMTEGTNVSLIVGNGGDIQSPRNGSHNAVDFQQPQANSERSGQSYTIRVHNRQPITATVQVPSHRGGNATIGPNEGLSCTGISTAQNSNAGLSFSGVNATQYNNVGLYSRDESLISSQTDSISSSQNSQISVSTTSTELSADDKSFLYLFDLWGD